MATSLLKVLGEGNKDYYEDGLRRMIEDHLPHMQLQNSTGGVLIVGGADGIKYKGDFFGLLRSYSIPQDMHWPMMRLNGLNSPYDYKEDMLSIKVVDPDYVSRLQQVYRNTRGKKA